MNITLEHVLAVAVVIFLVLEVGRTILDHRTKGDLLEALTETAKAAAANNKALDLLEPLATKVVPVELVTSFTQGAEFVKTFTPDQVDAFIDAVKLWATRATDGLPNEPIGGQG
jgi:ABC-type transporter MlaC component